MYVLYYVGGLGAWAQENFEFYQSQESVLGYFSVLLLIKLSSYWKFNIGIITNPLLVSDCFIRVGDCSIRVFRILLLIMESEDEGGGEGHMLPLKSAPASLVIVIL